MVEVFQTHPLDDFWKRDLVEYGKGVSVEVDRPNLMAQLFAAKGKSADICAALNIADEPGKASQGDGFIALPLSPGQWFIVSYGADGNDVGKQIADAIEGLGYLSEQSDSRVVFRIYEPKVRELMQKGCRLDLHKDQTGKDWCAQTQMAQASVLIHQIDEDAVYDLYVYSGFALHFAEWLEHTGAQLGIGFTRIIYG